MNVVTSDPLSAAYHPMWARRRAVGESKCFDRFKENKVTDIILLRAVRVIGLSQYKTVVSGPP